MGDAGGARQNTFTLNVAGPANEAPTVTGIRPRAASRIQDRTPLIRATVRDSATNLAKPNISLFVDGTEKTGFTYDRATDKLRFESGRLSFGRHTIMIEATDDQALTGMKTWSFRIIH